MFQALSGYKGIVLQKSYQGRYLYVLKPLHNISAIIMLIP